MSDKHGKAGYDHKREQLERIELRTLAAEHGWNYVGDVLFWLRHRLSLIRELSAASSLPPERAALVEQLKALADDDDTEQRHMDADAALLNYINDSEISAAFHAIKKWYA